MSNARVEPPSIVMRTLQAPASNFEARLLLVAQSGSASFIGKLFLNGSRLVTAIVLARVLGAQQYGLYNLALTTATFAASFAVLGGDIGLVRFIAVMMSRRDAPSLAAVMKLGVRVPLALSLGVGSVQFLAASPLALEVFGDASLVPLLQWAGVLIPFLVWNKLGEAVLRGFHRLGLAVLINSFAQPLLRFGFVLLVVLFWANALGGLTTYLFSVVAAAALFWLVTKTYLVYRYASPRPQLAGELIGFSLPVYLADVADNLGASAQTFLLGAWSAIMGVGIFAIAGQLAIIGRFFHGSLVMATMPVISEFYDRGAHEDLSRLFRATSKWSFALNLPLFLVLVLYPAQLLSAFGASFGQGAAALQILALSTLIETGTGIGGALLTMTGHTRLNLWNTLGTTLLQVGLGVLWIPTRGLVGAALAVFASTLVVNVLRLTQSYWLFRLLPYDVEFVKPLIAGGAALLVALLLAQWLPASDWLTLLFSIGALVGVYAVVVLVLGLSSEDRLVLARARAGLGARWSRRRAPHARARREDAQDNGH